MSQVREGAPGAVRTASARAYTGCELLVSATVEVLRRRRRSGGDVLPPGVTPAATWSPDPQPPHAIGTRYAAHSICATSASSALVSVGSRSSPFALRAPMHVQRILDKMRTIVGHISCACNVRWKPVGERNQVRSEFDE
jgi:hypothetical protein